MTLLVGAILAAGLLLCASPWLWPPGERIAEPKARTGVLTTLLEEAGLGGVRSRTLVIVMIAAAAI
ncbi:MAG TPA: type II secretion protein F, partial [Microbacterium sp.]|nr:type II secretion protein F [Microbacterium sp.]